MWLNNWLRSFLNWVPLSRYREDDIVERESRLVPIKIEFRHFKWSLVFLLVLWSGFLRLSCWRLSSFSVCISIWNWLDGNFGIFAWAWSRWTNNLLLSSNRLRSWCNLGYWDWCWSYLRSELRLFDFNFLWFFRNLGSIENISGWLIAILDFI